MFCLVPSFEDGGVSSLSFIISQTNFFQAPVELSYQSPSRLLIVDADTYVTQCVTGYHGRG